MAIITTDEELEAGGSRQPCIRSFAVGLSPLSSYRQRWSSADARMVSWRSREQPIPQTDADSATTENATTVF